MLQKKCFQAILGFALLSVSGVFTSCQKSPSDVPYYYGRGGLHDTILNSFVALGYISPNYKDSIAEFEASGEVTNVRRLDEIHTYAQLFEAVNEYYVEKQRQQNIYNERLQEMSKSISFRFVTKYSQSFGALSFVNEIYEIKNHYSKPISVIRAKVLYFNSSMECFGGIYGNDSKGGELFINVKPNQTLKHKTVYRIDNSVIQILKDIPNKDLKVTVEVTAVRFSDGTVTDIFEGLNSSLISTPAI